MRGAAPLKRVAFIDCSAGAAGDMLLAATLDVARKIVWDSADCAPWQAQIAGLLQCEPNARLELREDNRGGLAGLKVDFFVGDTHADHYHSHSLAHGSSGETGHGRHLKDILQLLEREMRRGAFAEECYGLAENIFHILAQAEAKVHGTTVDKVHFHEVGAFDSIMDVAGFAIAWHELAIAQVTGSPTTTGEGTVDTAHGCLGVPPPAVVEILRAYEIPTSGIPLSHEALTPTGAACLAAIVDQWGGMPAFDKILAQGVGLGTREQERLPNAVRLVVGE